MWQIISHQSLSVRATMGWALVVGMAEVVSEMLLIQLVAQKHTPGRSAISGCRISLLISTGGSKMIEKTRALGKVKLVQLQPSGLIIETPTGYFYDASRRVVVDRLLITSKGIEATTPDGEHVLDIHHLDHPDKAYDDDDLVCIGFTSHYEAMRARFGEHMVDGIAGENILIEYDKEVWTEDLGQQIAIENMETGQMTLLDLVCFAAPCDEFSHFAAQSQDKRLPAAELKATLQFLNNGRRGFLLVLHGGQGAATVQPGDRVFGVRSARKEM